MRSRLLELAAALSVTVSAACDNVQWGGAELALIPPPPKAATTPAGAVSVEGERMPQGPLLFFVTPSGTGATIVPVAEVGGDTLVPLRPTKAWQTYGSRFIADFMRRGSEFSVFRNGARVGSLVLQSATLPQTYDCTPLPVGVGTLELPQGTVAAGPMLALPKTQAPEVRNRLGPDIVPTRTMQVVGPILAERLLRARHAQLPGNWQRAMAQLSPFPLAGAVDPAFAATFVVGDTLGPGPAYGTVAYSLFMIATPQGNVGYDTAYVEFRDYHQGGGKSAARVLDYLDWNRDDQVELLARAYSDRQSWFEAFGKHGRGWRRIFREQCEAPGAVPSPASPESATAERPETTPAAPPATSPARPPVTATPGVTTMPGATGQATTRPAPRRPRPQVQPTTTTPATDTAQP